MNCREFVDFIRAWRDGELPDQTARQFRQHLGQCAPCEKYLHEYGEVIALAKGAFSKPEDEVPEEVPERLVDAVMAAVRRRKIQ